MMTLPAAYIMQFMLRKIIFIFRVHFRLKLFVLFINIITIHSTVRLVLLLLEKYMKKI